MSLRTTASEASVRSLAQRIAIPLCVLVQIAAQWLPALGVGDPVGNQSADNRTLLTPAGWAFAVWGPLFLGTILYAIYQALPAQRSNPLLARIGWASAGAFLGNGLWLIWTQIHGLSWPSVVIILFTLTCLMLTFRAFAGPPEHFSAGERWLTVLPLSALAGWLTAASIVNIAATLRFHAIVPDRPLALVAAIVILIGGAIAGVAIWRQRGNPWYAATFLWAVSAIWAAGGQFSPLIAGASALAMLYVIMVVIVRQRRDPHRRRWFQATS